MTDKEFEKYLNGNPTIEDIVCEMKTWWSEEGTDKLVQSALDKILEINEGTVYAIPVEFIANWMGKHQGLKFDGWNLAVGSMVNDWRKENEQSNISN